MRMRIHVVMAAAIFAAAIWSQTVPKNTRFHVKLSDSVSSKTSRPGDKVGAVVIGPVSLRGGRLEGVVEEAEGGRLRFHFTTLRFAGKEVPVRTAVTGVVNSKGEAGVDDFGRPVRIERGVIVVSAPIVAVEEGAEIRLIGEER